MWVIHNCLAFHGTCAPQSWAGLTELPAALVLIFGAVTAFFLALMSLG